MRPTARCGCRRSCEGWTDEHPGAMADLALFVTPALGPFLTEGAELIRFPRARSAPGYAKLSTDERWPIRTARDGRLPTPEGESC